MIQGDGGDGFSLPSLVNNMAVYSELFNGSEEEFIGKVFEENADLTSRSPATLTDPQGQGSNNSNQSNPTPPRSFPQPKDGSQGTGTSNKRKRGEDDEGESNHPNKPRKYGRHVGCEPYEQEHQRGRRLACHFHHFDKQRYCKNNRTGRKYETCSGPGWRTMHHLR
jgi:hypothetical protein